MKIYVPAIRRLPTATGDFFVRSASLKREEYLDHMQKLNALSDDSVSFSDRLAFQAELINNALVKYISPDGREITGEALKTLLEDEIIDIHIAKDILETYFDAELWPSGHVETDLALEVSPIGYGQRSRRLAELIEILPDAFGGSDPDSERSVVIELISLCTKTEHSRIAALYDNGDLSLQTLHSCVKFLTTPPEKKMNS